MEVAYKSFVPTSHSPFPGKVVKVHYALHDMAKVGKPLVDIETDHDVVDTGHGHHHDEGKLVATSFVVLTSTSSP